MQLFWGFFFYFKCSIIKNIKCFTVHTKLCHAGTLNYTMLGIVITQIKKLITIEPRCLLTADASRSFARFLAAALLSSHNWRCARWNVTNKRSKSFRLVIAQIQRFLTRYNEEIIDNMCWWINVKRWNLVGTRDSVAFFIGEHLLTRLMRWRADRSGCFHAKTLFEF